MQNNPPPGNGSQNPRNRRHSLRTRSRNRVSVGIVRAWAWTRQRMFGWTRRRPQPSITSSTFPSAISDAASSWDFPVIVPIRPPPSTPVTGSRSIAEETPRKRFQDRKLPNDHFSRVTQALIEEMKKNSQERRHALEPHMPDAKKDEVDQIREDSTQ